MSVLRRLYRSCLASPLRMATAMAVITPGMHLALSTLVERRKVTLRSEYPALLVGDPLLAVSAGLAARVAGPEALRRSPALRAPLGPIMVAGGLGFGVWQMCDELRRGVYTRRQTLSPSKLWHQLVVYPALTPLVAGSLMAALSVSRQPSSGRRELVGTGLAAAGVAAWAVTAWDAVHHPRPAHSDFDWHALVARARRPRGNPCGKPGGGRGDEPVRNLCGNPGGNPGGNPDGNPRGNQSRG